MWLLKLIPSEVWIGLTLLAMAVGAHAYLRSLRADVRAAQAQVAQLEATRAQAEAQAKDRIERIITNHASIVEDYHAALETRRADVARAESAARGLRREAEALRQRVAATPAAHRGEAATEATGVLADVLGQCVDRYRAVAAIADASRAAGEACERGYEVAR